MSRMVKARCPNGCRPYTDTPFFYPASQVNILTGHEGELGVLIYSDLTCSNRYTDGVAGVPSQVIRALDEYGDMPCCVNCGAEVERITTLRDHLSREY